LRGKDGHEAGSRRRVFGRYYGAGRSGARRPAKQMTSPKKLLRSWKPMKHAGKDV
jgi:hypothetical protein